MKEFCVLLDNGHGKDTAGKRSPVWKDGSQLFEWETNRRIVAEIEKRLRKLGIKVVRLVPEDKDISLGTRSRRANKYVEKYRCVMISVHCDAFDVPNGASGWTVYTTEKKNISDNLAQKFLDNFHTFFPDRLLRGHKEKNFTVIYMTQCPCVLTENFFMTTERDCRLLMSDEGIETIADLHVKSILDFQQEFYPETVKEMQLPDFIPYPMRVNQTPQPTTLGEIYFNGNGAS